MENIKQTNLELVTNANKIMHELDEKRVIKKIHNENMMVEKYVNYLKEKYTDSEINVMKKTLENEISTIAARNSVFVSVISILVVIITTIFSQMGSVTTNEELILGLSKPIWTLLIYIILITTYHFFTQYKITKKVKLLNKLNLI